MPRDPLLLNMTAEQYKSARKLRGTQAEVAEKLSVHRVTIAERETGAQVITREASLAIQALPIRSKSLAAR